MVEAVAYRARSWPTRHPRGERRAHHRVGRAPSARPGVDYIAVGELTHSARVLDLGLDLTGLADVRLGYEPVESEAYTASMTTTRSVPAGILPSSLPCVAERVGRAGW